VLLDEDIARLDDEVEVLRDTLLDIDVELDVEDETEVLSDLRLETKELLEVKKLVEVLLEDKRDPDNDDETKAQLKSISSQSATPRHTSS